MDNKRILIVDDSDDARSGLMMYLGSKGYDVSEAESGEKAIELLANNEYNLVLSDLKMQNIDGIGVLTEVKKLYPKTDVIIMTAYASIETAVDAMRHGGYDYIAKPLNMDELEMLIERCLEKQNLRAEVAGLKEIVNLYEVSKGLTSVMDLEKLLDLIVKLAADTLDAEGGSIMILDDKTGELIAQAATGKREDIVRGKSLKVGERIAGYAAQVGDTVKVDGSIKDDPRFMHLEKYDGINSGISVPLLWKNKLLGVINLSRSAHKKGFTPNETDLLTIYAAQAAIAIENSSLFNGLQQEKNKLDTIFSEMGSGAIITDDKMGIIIINQRAEDILDLGRNESLKKNFMVCAGDLRPSISWEEIQSAEKDLITFELSRETGHSICIAVSLSKIKDEKGQLVNYVLVLRNITEEKKEETIKRNFLRLMSHKLRTPLTSIIGYSYILGSEEIQEKLDASEKEAVSIIESEAQLLTELVDKLLRFTLLESESLVLDIKTVDLLSISNKVIESLEGLIFSRKAEVVISEELKDLPNVMGDREKIHEVLENLIENAIKWNDNAKKKVILTGKLDGDYVEMNVIDNGQGIPAEEQSAIFQKFYQHEEYFTGEREGIGLGLALARRLIEAQSGNLWVESTEDKGSCFKFTLPRVRT
ncbi:MAG: response regulator [Elusimicrobiota bacterium]